MTSGRRTKANRRQPRLVGHPAHMRRAQPGERRRWDGLPLDEMAVQAGWCATEAELTEARRATHDSLIAQLGPARRGGVSWMFETGEQAVALLDEVAKDPPSSVHADYFRQMRACLREYGGWIVVAMAPGERPPGVLP